MKLFHTVPRALEGDYLEARTEVDRNGFKGTFLFATTNLMLSLCYAMQNGTKLYSNTMEDGSVYVVVPRKTVQDERVISAITYSMHDDTFQHFRDNQYVTEYGMHRSELKMECEITSLNDLLEKGVQIFSTAPGYDDIPYEVYANPEIDIDLFTRDLFTSGKLVSLNEERGINPHPFFHLAPSIRDGGAQTHADCSHNGDDSHAHRTRRLSSVR